MDKLCFVTTGATAPFAALIQSVLSRDSLDALLQSRVTHLFIQFGAAKEVFETSAKAAREYLIQKGKENQLDIDGIDFDSSGLSEQFKLVQQTNGLAISHAGKLFIDCPHDAIFPLDYIDILPRCNLFYSIIMAL